MGFTESKWLWMNGQVVPWERGTVHVSAHGLHYGTGVFEGMRCYETDDGPAVFRLREHIQRMFASAAVYGINIRYSEAELVDGITELIRVNEFTSCYVRPICFFGSDTLNLHPRKCPVNVAMMAWPWGAYLGEEGVSRGVRVTVSPWKKIHPTMVPTTAKACGLYLNGVLAVRDAVERGFDEAVMLDADGLLSEGPGENIFVVHNNCVFTNDERYSILLGITRDCVIQISRDLGYKVHVGPVALEQMINADEAFFSGTAVEITPIREVDGKQIGSGAWPITRRLREVYLAATKGREPRYAHWLHPVRQATRVSAASSNHACIALAKNA